MYAVAAFFRTGFSFLKVSIILALAGTTAACMHAQTVSVVQTNPDQSALLTPQPTLNFASGSGSQNAITINDTVRYQTLDGVGATFNDSDAYLVWNKLTPTQRTSLMNDLFSTSGIHLNFLRQPMGATDLALSSYTYDDVPAGDTDPNMTQFSIAHDQSYMLPHAARRLRSQSQHQGARASLVTPGMDEDDANFERWFAHDRQISPRSLSTSASSSGRTKPTAFPSTTSPCRTNR